MLQKSGTQITSNNLTEYFLLLNKELKDNILILLGKNLYSKLISLILKFLRSKSLH